jgi:RNA polymerase primary sigma factor
MSIALRKRYAAGLRAKYNMNYDQTGISLTVVKMELPIVDSNIKVVGLPSMINLDMDINEEGDTLFDVLKNDEANMPDESFNTKDILKTKLLGLLTCLDEREKTIIEDYFGLTGSPRTLEDIGGDFNLTKERVRQIKEKSLRKLRNLSSDLFEWM